ncbi:tRNA glutamyl-Q(34) synthetase GluQRS [Pararhizobium haloflavum]|uniref:tRNA glutamyl-Q(34) synthetase GluQRS n=1 Tax=Pararhizobium haloflavum TaxID=2037914 RepID=UPI000C1A2615|nr:tRNA glutamyl-Q(34) synthetase GluQRS [Pararhizobium haloflavum]
MTASSQPVFRFAPSPNGRLHLGHAYSALINRTLADETGGRLLLRIEDIDRVRCTPALEAAMIGDLDWLGVRFDPPLRRQSEHFDTYRALLDRLVEMNIAYPAFLSRGALSTRIAEAEAGGQPWPRDPDGAPIYPPDDKHLDAKERRTRIAAGEPFAWRLDMEAALKTTGTRLTWRENGKGPGNETGLIAADPMAWGDVVLARSDTPTSYHLSVVADDAAQKISHVVRGQDLFHATAVHRLLQVLLGLPEPQYRHHALVRDATGRKLSKSDNDTALAALRDSGSTPSDIRSQLGVG